MQKYVLLQYIIGPTDTNTNWPISLRLPDKGVVDYFQGKSSFGLGSCMTNLARRYLTFFRGFSKVRKWAQVLIKLTYCNSFLQFSVV